MTKKDNNLNGGALTLMQAVFVLFLGLKLADVISWNWFFVFLPLILHWLWLLIAFCISLAAENTKLKK